jgi:hypothetical protein
LEREEERNCEGGREEDGEEGWRERKKESVRGKRGIQRERERERESVCVREREIEKGERVGKR